VGKFKPFDLAIALTVCVIDVSTKIGEVACAINACSKSFLVRSICEAIVPQLAIINEFAKKLEKGADLLSKSLIEGPCFVLAAAIKFFDVAPGRSSQSAQPQSLSAADEEPIDPELLALLNDLVTEEDSFMADLGQSLDEMNAALPPLRASHDLITQDLPIFLTAAGNWAGAYYQLSGAIEARGQVGFGGSVEWDVPPDEIYVLKLYDPRTHAMATISGRSARGVLPGGASDPTRTESYVGSPKSLGTDRLEGGPPFFKFDPISEFSFLDLDEAPDSDGDGLFDAGELVIGTLPNNPDSDGDGVSDQAEVLQGLNPLDGLAFPTGIISSLALPGEANIVTIDGSIVEAGRQTAYIATGSHGLAIVDVTKFDNPIVLGQLDLDGTAVDVAVDADLQIAAVAAATGGLHLVDVSDPMLPRVLLTYTDSNVLPANQVEVVGGIAYLATGNAISAIDMLTGKRLQLINSSGGAITGLAREGLMLYTIDTSNRLQAVDISGVQMVARGGLTMPHGAGQLFVGNNIAYVAASNNDRGGFATANVADSDNLTLISASDVASPLVAPATAIVANGSGLGLLVGSPNVFDVMDVSDPANTNDFIVRIGLPAAPRSVTLASGVAYVADGASGIQVVNYLPFDNAGQAPTVTLGTSAADADPATDGLQVQAGSLISIVAAVGDDVQVRNVELLQDGEAVANDVSFPFDFTGIAPRVGAGTATTTLQVRATDTGGNVTLSNILTLDVIPDTTAPIINHMDPADGALRGTSPRSIRVYFSEALEPINVNETNFHLADGAGNPVVLSDLGLRLNDRMVQLTFDELPVGTYRLVIAAENVTDRAGNPLGSSDVISEFTIIATTTRWINPASGVWSNPNNWSGGVVPLPTDDVLIGAVGANYTVTLDINPTLGSLTLDSPNATLSAVGRTVTASGSSTLAAGRLFMENSTWAGEGILTNDADMLFRGNSAILSPFVQNGVAVIQSFNPGGGTSDRVATLTAASGFTNAGTIVLDSSNAGEANTTLAVTSGTLTNAATGVINSNAGVGGRVLAGSLTNLGTVNINRSTTFARMDGVYSNDSIFTIAPGQALTITGLNQTFHQNAGTLTNNGAINVMSATVGLNGGTLNNPGSVNVSSGTFDFNGGAASGTPVLLTNSALNFGLGSTGAGSFTVRETSSLSGDIAAGQTVVIQSFNPGGGTSDRIATLTAASGFTNAGTIVLDSSNAGEANTTLAVTSGTLTNAATGVINSNAGVGGRTITAEVNNAGTITVNKGTGIGRTGAVHVNSGVFVANATAFFSGVTLTNEPGGVIAGTGTLSVPGMTFTNAGIIRPGGIGVGVLSITGNYLQTATGSVEIQIGGLVAGTEFDRLAVSGSATLAGIIAVSLFNGFIPALTQRFQIMTFASRMGVFDNVLGFDLGGGLRFDTDYSNTDLELFVTV